MTKPNDPAFPGPGEMFIKAPDGQMRPQGAFGMEGPAGITKREYFSAMAMQGLLAHPLKVDAVPAEPMIAAMARLMADALISELNKPPEEPK